jgi:hypothetical protein
MQLQQWILFLAGLVVIFVGVCLMAYGALAKRAFAGKETKKESKIAQIIRALAVLVKALGDYLGANIASKVGLLLIVVGLLMIYFSFRIAA